MRRFGSEFYMTHCWRTLSRVSDLPIMLRRSVRVQLKYRGALGRAESAAGGALTLTFKYSSNLDANRRTPGSIRRSSIQTGWRARFSNSESDTGVGEVALRCVSQISRRGRRAGRQAHRRRHRRWSRSPAARWPRYMSRCERALRAVLTDSQCRRRPTVCPTARTAARVAPPRCTPPAPLPLCPPRSPPPPAAHPPRPEEFSASGGKNRLCSGPRIISARRTAPLRPQRASQARDGQAHMPFTPRLSPANHRKCTRTFVAQTPLILLRTLMSRHLWPRIF